MPAAALLALLALAGAGCAEEEEPPPSLTRGPAQPQGDLVTSSATLRPGEPFETMATAIARSRGTGEALLFGMAVVDGGSPQFRLTINGEPAKGAETQTLRGGGGEIAATFCACDLRVGESDIAYEARASGGGRLGARSLIAFTPAVFENGDSARGGEVLDAAAIDDETVNIPASGAPLSVTELESDADRLVVLAAFRGPLQSSSSPESVRLEALVDGEGIQEAATTRIPSGGLVAFYDPNGADAGAQIEVRGFVTAGNAPVAVSAIAVCPCGLEQ